MARGVGLRSYWRRDQAYAYLLGVERSMFAWEWLRRTEDYRLCWSRVRRAPAGRQAEAAQLFGLAELLAPELGADRARPVWLQAADPRVVPARPLVAEAEGANRFDIRTVAAWVTVVLDEDDIEHWRIGTAARSVRLDVHEGTLLGGPTGLAYQLSGLPRLAPKLPALAELIRLAHSARPVLKIRPEKRARRWIAELRAADALAAGARQLEIAEVLFARELATQGWRARDESLRLRVQRLVRNARARLADPLAADWFRD